VTQLGVLVFMFAAGAEFDLSSLKGQRSRALLISHAGIALPFLLGLLLALPLFAHYAPAGVAFSSFALFLGIALSITAFPVLLRILEDRGYTTRTDRPHRGGLRRTGRRDRLGHARHHRRGGGVEQRAGGVRAPGRGAAAGLACASPSCARRSHARGRRAGTSRAGCWCSRWRCSPAASPARPSACMRCSAPSSPAWCSPPTRACAGWWPRRSKPFATVLLVPLFFATTGLRTRIDLLTGYDWALCGAIVVIATAGKLGGTVLAARASGVDRVDAWRLGALMNTRGLMELIVLGIGYDLGLIDRNLFAILVLVAIITTVMTGRILGFIDNRHPQPLAAP
jgi:hypothetical protein